MKRKFMLCVDNEGYEASLEIRKLYEKIPDKEAERPDQVRIIDESGEDYLYPSSFFCSRQAFDPNQKQNPRKSSLTMRFRGCTIRPAARESSAGEK
jgi:hypothetical protein